MKCLDDCHDYELVTVYGQPKRLFFYKMGPEAKVDGVTNEEVLSVLIHRLKILNGGEFNCRENSLAITKLEEALMWLDKRTHNRIDRGVEGKPIP